MSDISTIVATSRPINILHPRTGQETGLVIHLLPTTAPAVKAVKQRFTNEALAARGRNKTTAQKLEANSIELLAAAIDKWEWNVGADGTQSSFGGEQLELNEKNAKKVVKVDWIRAQIDEELGDDAAFFRLAD